MKEVYSESEQGRLDKERDERRIAERPCCVALGTHTTQKCLPFLLPSLLCRVAVCSQALVQILVSLLVSGESTELFNSPTGSIS